MFLPDLTNCDREPIHIPGKVQGHGFLIAIDADFVIRYCSENIKNFLPLEVSQVLGKPIDVIEPAFNSLLPNFFSRAVGFSIRRKHFEPANPYSVEIAGQEFNLILSQSNDFYMLEFEPEASNLEADLQHLVGRSLSEMLSDKELSRLLYKSAVQVKNIIGFDRVMIYKFHEDEHGEVVAEAKNEDLEPLLGLHYPASDIPRQARELYKLNLTRLIADVHSEDSALLAEPGSVPLDLTCSALRAVSPIHIQYLKNMKVASSFSISILNQDNLWGLIACHNYTPRFINYRQRESARLVGQVLSSAISFRQQDEDQEKFHLRRRAIEAITRSLLRNTAIEEALTQGEVTLQSVLPSSGAALFLENKLTTIGNVPDERFINQLLEWLPNQMDDDVFYTNQLPVLFAPASPYKDVACGLLACRFSKELKEFMLWFRPEVITTVNWAGNPDKPVEYDADGIAHISPRKSFAVWTQNVAGTSVEWKPEDVKVAVALRDEVNHLISRKATELRVLNEKLRHAYAELDTFSYTISHDLKNPLTTIKSYSQLINSRFSLEPKVKDMVSRIAAGANKMQSMIDEVLQYSRVGQSKLETTTINMRELLDELTHDLQLSSANQGLRFIIEATPDVRGEQTMMHQIFSNVIGNAVKYSQKAAEPVVKISGNVRGNEVIYAVSDNGIGIPEAEQAKVFDLFSRAKGVEEFEGTGVGLAIVKRIVEKHHGRIWVESEPGNGTTFFIALPV
ncbi:ATP-binding protein [Mucilaginibacter sp. RS28]|uniref:histidine kinase n=2 Tax=Mucilaginibacter straminoryzae TaxID=2932774 RepID=A0A9X1X111_9SPHI|nr:ATP-binding protein [Mucilaginibacter straminoryzae]MCJ8209257.1 ATP-binding protein [Mucilaginibacter straminoryzae]